MPCNRFSLNPAYILSHDALDSQRDIADSQYDVAHVFSPFLPQNTRFLAEPRRVGPPSRHGCLPTRRGSRFFALFDSKYSLPCRATSCWTSIATWLPSNTTWLTFFISFYLKFPTSFPCHVVLDLHRDMAAFQHDVAPLFTPKNHPRYTGSLS